MREHKLWLAVIVSLILAMAMSFTACGGSSDEAATEDTEAADTAAKR